MDKMLFLLEYIFYWLVIMLLNSCKSLDLSTIKYVFMLVLDVAKLVIFVYEFLFMTLQSMIILKKILHPQLPRVETG